MGRAHLAQKEYEKARECYKKALECDPKKDSLIKGKIIVMILITSYMKKNIVVVNILIYKMHVRIANREYPDQTACSEAI